MCAPWRAELPSETVLMFCKLCWGSGNICVLCVSVAVGSLCVSLQQLVHLVRVHGTWHTVRLGEVCWMLQNVMYSRLKRVKVTECVCARACVLACGCVCVKYSLVHAAVFSETENLLQTDRLLYCHKHRQFSADCCIIWNRPLHSLSYSYCSHQWYRVSCSYVAVALYWVPLKTGSESTSELLWFCVDMLGNVCTSMLYALLIWYWDSYPLQTVLYSSA